MYGTANRTINTGLSRGARILLGSVAALLGVNQISDLMAVEDAHTFKRPIYAGNAIITVKAPAEQIVVATVRAASWPEAAKGGSAAVDVIDGADLVREPQHVRADVPDAEAYGTVVAYRAQRARGRRRGRRSCRGTRGGSRRPRAAASAPVAPNTSTAA